ncbi:MAG: aminodeoxychorismate synthase component I [Methylophilaceae bacterium]
MKIKELNYQCDSSSYFERIKHLDWPVFLDSCYQKDKPNSEFAHFDIITAEPFKKISCNKEVTILSDKDGDQGFKKPSLEVLSDEMSKYLLPNNEIPFVGGAIGYCSYELNIKTSKKNLIDAMKMGIYDWAIIVDHFREKSYIVSMLFDDQTKILWPKLESLFSKDIKNIHQDFKIKDTVRDNLSFKNYKKKFNNIMNYINAGDCYQINLSKKFDVDTEGDSWNLYKKFRDVNKSPFMAYLLYDEFEILCGSPERFINSKSRRVTTRPIKGTRARGKTAKVDKKNANELLNSKKDQSENLMIVDLLRNDLSINCEVGSVEVDELFKIESYPNVHHLVSTISGILREDSNNFKLFSDSFPGGSITGAPKKRATEIIDEQEEHARDLYCGSVCYFSFDGSMDSNIAIRSMVHLNKKLHFYSGGGLTSGSNVKDEYQEIEDKAENIKQTLNFFKE